MDGVTERWLGLMEMWLGYGPPDDAKEGVELTRLKSSSKGGGGGGALDGGGTGRGVGVGGGTVADGVGVGAGEGWIGRTSWMRIGR